MRKRSSGRGARTGLAVAVLIVVLAGCSRSEPAPQARVRVFATNRARDTLEPLLAMYERRNPGTRVSTTYGNPLDLQAFLARGDRPNLVLDNFIGAVPAYAPFRAEGTADASLGSDELRIVTPIGNPKGVTGLASLGAVPRVGLCSPVTVCGAATDGALTAAGAALPSAQRSTGGDLAMSAAEYGLDAAIVFGSDIPAAARDRLEVVALDPANAARTDYDLMTVTPSPAADRLRTWLTADPEAQAYLARHGLRPPGGAAGLEGSTP